jgi:hypothetical protein
MAPNSKLSSPLHGRKTRGANAALHHAPLAFDQLKLAKPEQIAHMIDAAARAFCEKDDEAQPVQRRADHCDFEGAGLPTV